MATKVCVIGLDCAPPELVFEKYRADLPNLSNLMNRGIYGPLESAIPPITVPAWMCMMTGRDPGELGIYGFRNRRDHTYEGLTFANNRMVRVETVWDVLAAQGKKSILIGVPLTYPPKPINGLLVGDFLAPDTKADYTFPSELKLEIQQVVGDYIIDVRGFRTDDKERLLQDIRKMTVQRFKLARHLAVSKPWDFFMMVEMGPDRLHHGFWRFIDPSHPHYIPGNRFENAVREYYIELDGLIGNFLEAIPDDTLVCVVSDHGARCMEGGICFNDWLMREGYLVLKEPVGEVSKLTPEMIDWTKTTAWGDGGYYGRLFINVRGREPNGIVDPAKYDSVREEIAIKLTELGDERGESIGTKVFKPEDVYKRVNNVAPDLVVYFGNLSWRSVGTIGHSEIWTHENDTGPDDANHSQFGLAIMTNLRSNIPGVTGSREGMSLYDIAPTILKAFGFDPPEGMGRTAIGTVSNDSVYTAEEEEEIARRLEDLGYL